MTYNFYCWKAGDIYFADLKLQILQDGVEGMRFMQDISCITQEFIIMYLSVSLYWLLH
jgi:hypothetical protein